MQQAQQPSAAATQAADSSGGEDPGVFTIRDATVTGKLINEYDQPAFDITINIHGDGTVDGTVGGSYTNMPPGYPETDYLWERGTFAGTVNETGWIDAEGSVQETLSREGEFSDTFTGTLYVGGQLSPDLRSGRRCLRRGLGRRRWGFHRRHRRHVRRERNGIGLLRVVSYAGQQRLDRAEEHTTHMTTGSCGHDRPSHTHEDEDWVLADRPEHPEEACGVVGVYAPGEDVARLTYFGLHALQHRGQESAGIAVGDGETVTVTKNLGLVSRVFKESDLDTLTGDVAIGHTRYSTTGSSTSWENAQPMLSSIGQQVIALAHNGNLVNISRAAR